jgi:hypothetical protein
MTKAIADIRRDLAGTDESMRAMAAEAMYDVNASDIDCSSDLIPLLRDPNGDVRECVLGNIGRLGNAAAAVIPDLSAIILDENEEEWARTLALNSLVLIGPKSIASIRSMSNRADSSLASSICDALSGMARFGNACRDAVPIVLDLMRRHGRPVQVNGMETLKLLAESMSEALRPFVRSGDHESGIFCAFALGKAEGIKHGDLDGFLQLEGLSDYAFEVLLQSIALVESSTTDSMIAVLNLGLKHASRDIRFAASESIGTKRISDPNLLKGVESLISDDDPLLVARAIQTLGEMRYSSDSLIFALMNNASDGNVDRDVRFFSIWTLARMPDQLPAFRKLFSKLASDPTIGEAAHAAFIGQFS